MIGPTDDLRVPQFVTGRKVSIVASQFPAFPFLQRRVDRRLLGMIIKICIGQHAPSGPVISKPSPVADHVIPTATTTSTSVLGGVTVPL